MRYSVMLIWDEDDEVWVAEVPAMASTATSGATVEEALAMAQELIEGRIAVHRDYGEPVPLKLCRPRSIRSRFPGLIQPPQPLHHNRFAPVVNRARA